MNNIFDLMKKQNERLERMLALRDAGKTSCEMCDCHQGGKKCLKGYLIEDETVANDCKGWEED